jgi:hypothetical protein
MSTIETISTSHPDIAHRITQLLESDLKTNGIKTIEKFDPEKFRVQFFHFPYHHPKTVEGFKRLDKMIQRLTIGDRGMRHLKTMFKGSGTNNSQSSCSVPSHLPCVSG